MVRTKLTRLLYFVGAGTVCTVGINKYREIERNSMIEKQQQQLVEPPLDNRSNSEAIADLPMKRGEVVGVSSDEVVGHAVDAHCLSLAGMVRDADRLRLSTLKELMGILTPRQGVDLLASTKKLNLSLHEWGKRINRHSGEKGILLPE